MNKSNQSKYNKRIESNILELNIVQLNDIEYKHFKRNLDVNRNFVMLNRKSSYRIVELARDMAIFENTSAEHQINRLNGAYNSGCIENLKRLGVVL